MWFHMENNKRAVCRKMKSNNGFSLTEVLATVLLVGLLGIGVTTGINTVSNTYLLIIRKANEQILLSTTLTELKNKLRYAADAETESGIVSRICSEEGIWFDVVNGSDEDPGLKIRYYVDEDETDPQEKNIYDLVPQADGSVSDVYSSLDEITYEDGIFVITGLTVGDTELDEYRISSIKKQTGDQDDA